MRVPARTGLRPRRARCRVRKEMGGTVLPTHGLQPSGYHVHGSAREGGGAARYENLSRENRGRGTDEWPQVEGDPPYDGIYSINVIHIMAKRAIPSFFAGCGRNLRPGGLLGLYDTWTFAGEFIGPNNARFDASLRSQGYGGVAAIEECDEAASKAGLERIDVSYLPANNQFVTYRKIDDGDITPASLEFREAVMRAEMQEEDRGLLPYRWAHPRRTTRASCRSRAPRASPTVWVAMTICDCRRRRRRDKKSN